MLLDNVPAMLPFKGPDAISRESGVAIRLRLGANESVFGISSRAQQVIEEACKSVPLYGDPRSYLLRSTINAKYEVDFERTLVASGVDELIALSVRAIVEQGDTVITTDGSYPTFRFFANSVQAKILTVPYSNYYTDLNSLSKLAHDKNARLVYLANPDNPTGTYHEPELIARFIQDLPKTCYLILDEAYIDFVSETPIGIEYMGERVIRCRSFSKAYALAGLRIGYAVLSERLSQSIDKIRMHFGVNRVAQEAAAASLWDDDHLANVVRQTRKAKADYYEFALKCNLSAPLSATNFVLFEIGDHRKAINVSEQLLKNGIFTSRPSGQFVSNCIRVTVALAQEQREFCELLERILAEQS